VRVLPVARKLSTIQERRQDQSCVFRREDYRNRGHNHEKSVLGSRPGEDFGFRHNFSYDIQRYVSSDQAYGKLSGNKD
jgi:hypothetical protein